METNAQGMQSVMILRRDQQLGWMLMPAQRMYQKLDLRRAQEQSRSQPSDQVTISEVGTDTVEGQAATRYKMLMKDGSGGGFIWITQDGIPVKMDFVGKSGRDKTRMTVTLTNLTIGTQDPVLFEPPADYKAMPSFPG
jgi:FtsP/CotA-like multicopper oxidase with cupredoxin domain